jgi:hypothetical protein
LACAVEELLKGDGDFEVDEKNERIVLLCYSAASCVNLFMYSFLSVSEINIFMLLGKPHHFA